MHTLPKLPYDYNALEPYIDEETMLIHHTKHHQTYITKLNEALASQPELESESVEKLLTKLNDIPEAIRKAVQNHGGGHANHSLFWESLQSATEGENLPEGTLKDSITKTFGDYAKFKQELADAALKVFGSGWVWLVTDSDGKISIMATANQDSPLSIGKTPLLGLDVWEHAYYLKYQNRRPEYIEAFFKIINWPKVNERYNNH